MMHRRLVFALVVLVVVVVVATARGRCYGSTLGPCGAPAVVHVVQLERRHIADAGDYVALLGSSARRAATRPGSALVSAFVEVPAERLEALGPDALVELFDTRGHAVAAGPVTSVSPIFDERAQTVLIGTIVDDELGLLRAGRPVRARVVFHFGRGVTVPATAVWHVGGRSFVWVAEARGAELVARRRAVSLGALVGDAYVVRGGVDRGERVVVDGARPLADGTPIAVAR
jgi:hypothetical protein